MAVRYKLHLSKLDAFAEWAEALGYVRQEAKGDYEVLRLKHGGQRPLVYHQRLSGDHASYPDGSEEGKLVSRWLRSRKTEATS